MPKKQRRLNQQERHAQILALLRREGTVRIATLAEAFNVTTETARRDLDALGKGGALKRTYGGGAGRSLIDEPGIGVRSQARASQRALIGATAASMVAPGDALMIDCGSTTTYFANALAARNLRLSAVTNSVAVAKVMATSSACRVILCPGEYVMREGGVYGSDAIDFIRRFNVNTAIIGAGGVTAEGVTDADSLSCAIKRAMIERAHHTVLLADSSKFDVVQFERVCPLSDIDVFVSDASPPSRLAARFQRADVQVVVAGK
jgi:DeoR family transcriptional regulator, glycerol-3-phosphate regulon repressor